MTEKISLDPMDTSKKNSPVAGPVSEEATIILNNASDTCVWNNREFPEGTVVESEGAVYECSFGQWNKRG